MSKSRQLQIPREPLKIGVVQMTSGENIAENVEQAFSALTRLKRSRCDLICFPENSLFLRIDKKFSGRNFLNLKEKFWGELQKFSTEQESHLMFGSVPIRAGRKDYNSTILISPKRKPKIVYNKIHLFDVDVKGAPSSRESDSCHGGKKPAIIKIKDWLIGLSICYDLRFAELYTYYAKKNVHVIMVPAAFLVPTGRAHWHVLLRARAIESQAYVVAAAQSGGHVNEHGDHRETFGHSLVVSPWGEVLADLGDRGVAVKALELTPLDLKKVRQQIPMHQHRRLS